MNDEDDQTINATSPKPTLTVGDDVIPLTGAGVIPLTAPPADDGNRSIPLSLTEFCRRLSRKDKRIELIGAFHFDMTRRGLTWAHEAEFVTAFHAFTGGKPAKE